MLNEELKKLGYHTVLTHDGQTFPVTSAYDYNNKYKPQERTAFANSVDIDYYVSIHCNAHNDPTAEGTRIYYFDGAIKREHTSGQIAESINSGVLHSLGAGAISSTIEMTTGVFHVIRETVVPASLVEMGFVTNESDAAKMLDEEWQRAFAKGVAQGIDDYYRSLQN
jgi:N-acetylmuramoyl-L-alanine amidase